MEQYKYQEAMANIRHYSNLRFAMLTVFVAITGGLLTASYSESIKVDTTIFGMNIIRATGIWISTVFFIFEVALDIYLDGLWNETGNTTSSYRKALLKWSVRVAAASIPVISLFYWLCVYNS
jgi:hypothetical protein